MAVGQRVSPQQLANGLGWFSIGLGLAEVAAPNLVADLIGVRNRSKTRNVLRFYGAREIAAGIGILAQSNPSPWLWARVAGDVLDLSSLCKSLARNGNDRAKTLAAAAAVIGVTVADVRCAFQLTGTQTNGNAGSDQAPISSFITIARQPEEVYGFWRDFTRLPEIVDRLESVRALDGTRSHWSFALPMGRTLEWDAEVTEDQRNCRIAWRSLSPAAPHSGAVTFEPATGQRGTKVTVKIRPEVMGFSLGKAFGLVPEQFVNIALHNLKQLLETGEIVKSDASIHRGPHPARPAEQYTGAPSAVSA